jgi:hypothetical protein
MFFYVVCCRVCLSDSHRSCETVIPLDIASKDVKNSSLLSDTLKEQDYMTETLQKMEENQFILEDDGILDPTDDKSIT